TRGLAAPDPAAHARARDVRAHLALHLAERHRTAGGGAGADVDQPLPLVCASRGCAPEAGMSGYRNVCKGGASMETRPMQHHATEGIRRRRLLQTGRAAGASLAAWPLYPPAASWGAEAGGPKRGGILRARGADPVHFDPHLTRAF